MILLGQLIYFLKISKLDYSHDDSNDDNDDDLDSPHSSSHSSSPGESPPTNMAYHTLMHARSYASTNVILDTHSFSGMQSSNSLTYEPPLRYSYTTCPYNYTPSLLHDYLNIHPFPTYCPMHPLVRVLGPIKLEGS